MRTVSRQTAGVAAAPGGERPRPVPGRFRRSLPLLAWLGSLLAGVVLFHAMGAGPLEAPPVTDPGAWGEWASARDPLTAVVAILRLVVLALAWYLVGVTTIGIVARLSRAARLVRVADALTVPAVRRLLQGALGLSLATAMVGAASPAAHHPVPPAHVTLAAVGSDEAAVGSDEAAVGSDEAAVGSDEAGSVDEVVLREAGAEVRLTRADGGDEVQLARADGDVSRPATVPLPLELLDGAVTDDEVTLRQVVDDEQSATTHEVVAGESFWTIALETLRSAGGQDPDDDVLHAYWEQLIDVNRDRLADADNPDLIFPGQQLELPPLPPDVAERA